MSGLGERISALARNEAPGPADEALSRRLATDPASVLSQSISFVPAAPNVSTQAADSLKSKYRHLRPPADPSPVEPPVAKRAKAVSENQNPSHPAPPLLSPNPPSDGIPPPAMDIHKAHVVMEWESAVDCPAALGLPLNNMGNTCFLNSVLQVLTHTPPLVHFLSVGHAVCHGGHNGFCGLCELRSHVQSALTNRKKAATSFSFPDSGGIVPSRILQRMRMFMKSYMRGRQEDAHELLRYLLDSLQTACLVPFRSHKLDMFSKHTTAIGKIFGGFHRNEITCMQCNGKSTTYDPFMDVALDVKRFGTIEEALKSFTKVEFLSADNAYKCRVCKNKVRARKQYTVHRPPHILTIQLKRFDAFGKVNSQIRYQERLNLRPFMSETSGPVVTYRLYASIVHQGGSTHSGHYYAFVRNRHGDFHMMDDDRVSSIGTKSVLNQPAYLLFYARQQPPPAVAVKPRLMGRGTPAESAWCPVTAPLKPAPSLMPSHTLNRAGQPVHVVEPLKQERKPVKLNFLRKAPQLGVKVPAKPMLQPSTSLVPYGSDDSNSSSPEHSPPTQPKKEPSPTESHNSAKSGSNSPTYNVFSRLKKEERKSKMTTPEEFLSSASVLKDEPAEEDEKPMKEEKTSVETRGSEMAKAAIRDRSASSGDENSARICIKMNLAGSGKWRISNQNPEEAEASAMAELRAQKEAASTSSAASSIAASSTPASTPTVSQDNSAASSPSSERRRRKRKRKREREEAEKARVEPVPEEPKEEPKRKKKKHRRERSPSPAPEEPRRKKKKNKKNKRRRRSSSREPDEEHKSREEGRSHKDRDNESREEEGGRKDRRGGEDVASELREAGGLHGLGADLRSWSGAESALSGHRRREEEWRGEDERRHSDEEGRTHHKPHHHYQHRQSVPSYNRFQYAQDRRNVSCFVGG